MSSDLEAERLLTRARKTKDSELGVRLLFEAFLALSRTAAPARLTALAEEMTARRPPSPTPATALLFHTLLGVVGVRAGRFAAARHLRIALDLFAEHHLEQDALHLECAILATLTLIRPHEVRARYASHVDQLALDPGARARLVSMIGLADAWAGNLVRGQAEMLEGRDLAARAGRLDVQAEVTSWLIKCEALRGDLTASAAHLAEARDLAARTGSAWVAANIVEGSAALYFALDDTEAWVGLLELMVGGAMGGDSGLLYEYRWELATHHALRGASEVAAGLLDEVPPAPTGWPGGLAMAAWRAWIAKPDDVRVMADFEVALADLVQPAERLPRARMAWLLGATHARAGRRAAAVRLLEAACSGYATIGAAGMLALAAADLRLVSNRTPAAAPAGPTVSEPPTLPAAPTLLAAQTLLAPRPGELPLTGAEVRVAVAVADGLTNKETAQRLFVSAKTVEFHLGNIFRKLDVRNRTELARWRDHLG